MHLGIDICWLDPCLCDEHQWCLASGKVQPGSSKGKTGRDIADVQQAKVPPGRGYSRGTAGRGGKEAGMQQGYSRGTAGVQQGYSRVQQGTAGVQQAGVGWGYSRGAAGWGRGGGTACRGYSSQGYSRQGGGEAGMQQGR